MPSCDEDAERTIARARPRCRGPFSWPPRRLGPRSICPPNCGSSRRDRGHVRGRDEESGVDDESDSGEEAMTANMTMTLSKFQEFEAGGTQRPIYYTGSKGVFGNPRAFLANTSLTL
jgi:hypothetical protein